MLNLDFDHGKAVPRAHRGTLEGWPFACRGQKAQAWQGMSQGFTLIEVMVTLAIIVLLMLFMLPSMGTYAANSKIRAQTQNLSDDLQAARATAIQRNNLITLFFTEEEPVKGNVSANSVAGAAAWIVRTGPADATTLPAGATPEFISGQTTRDSGGAPSVKITGKDIAHADAAVQTVTFNGFGKLADGGNLVFNITGTADGSCATTSNPGKGLRCLSVLVSPSGQVRICDPLIDKATNDTRRC